MESIIDLFNTLLKVAFFGGLVLLITKFIKFKKFNTAKAEISNLQAKLSQLRLALKGKVKKKSNTFRASLKTALHEGDPIDTAFKDLIDNPLESGADLQSYFDLSRKIVGFLHLENKTEAAPDANIENNFMCSDFKTEMDIVRIIKEMTDFTSRINSRIEDYNRLNPNYPIPKNDSLVFDSLTEIHRIFKEEGPAHSFESDASSNKKAS